MTRTRDIATRRIRRIEALGEAYHNASPEVKAKIAHAVRKKPLSEWHDRCLLNFNHCIHNGSI
jgi:hypothetical protein